MKGDTGKQLPDTIVSLALGQWLPTGQVWVLHRSGVDGGVYPIALNFWGGEQLRPLHEWASRMGCTPFPQEMFADKNVPACPRHGSKYVAVDKAGRGYFCTHLHGDEFCNWRSWQDGG